MVKASQKSTDVVVPVKSSHRSSLNPPRKQKKRKQQQTVCSDSDNPLSDSDPSAADAEPVVSKKAALKKKSTASKGRTAKPVRSKGGEPSSDSDTSDAEPVVPKKTAAKEKSIASKGPITKPVLSKKRKKAASQEDSAQSSAKPVVTNKRNKRASPGDSRANLTKINHTAKNKDVAKGTKLQIKVGKTLYNATVTEVLNDELVKVCTKDEDASIANKVFTNVRLTKEQATDCLKSGKTYGFTSKKANVGFPVEGAHDY